MDIEKRPLLIASAIGAAILILLSAVNFALTYWAAPANLDPAEGGGVLGCLSALACLAVAGISVMTGSLYVLLTPAAMPLTTGEYAVGGAAAAGLANLVSGLLVVCATVALFPMLAQQFEPAGGEPGVGSAAGLVLAVILGLTYLVLYAAMGAVAGAAGAAAAAAWRGRRADPSSA